MKAFRLLTYMSGHEPPLTMGVLEDAVELEDPTPKDVRDAFLKAAPPPGFLVIREFEVDDDTTLEDFMQGALKEDLEARRAIETDMAIMYYWTTHLFTTRVKPKGVVANSEPAPFDVDDVVWTLENIALAPEYDGHTVVSFASDGTPVTLRAGSVLVERISKE